jgi:hypothetical protein
MDRVCPPIHSEVNKKIEDTNDSRRVGLHGYTRDQTGISNESLRIAQENSTRCNDLPTKPDQT